MKKSVVVAVVAEAIDFGCGLACLMKCWPREGPHWKKGGWQVYGRTVPAVAKSQPALLTRHLPPVKGVAERQGE
jgi:hypothetical protein